MPREFRVGAPSRLERESPRGRRRMPARCRTAHRAALRCRRRRPAGDEVITAAIRSSPAPTVHCGRCRSVDTIRRLHRPARVAGAITGGPRRSSSTSGPPSDLAARCRWPTSRHRHRGAAARSVARSASMSGGGRPTVISVLLLPPAQGNHHRRGRGETADPDHDRRPPVAPARPAFPTPCAHSPRWCSRLCLGSYRMTDIRRGGSSNARNDCAAARSPAVELPNIEGLILPFEPASASAGRATACTRDRVDRRTVMQNLLDLGSPPRHATRRAGAIRRKPVATTRQSELAQNARSCCRSTPR